MDLQQDRYTVTHHNRVYSSEEQFVWAKLWEYNRKHVPKDHMPSEIYNKIYRDETATIVAAIFCESYFQYMYVKLLWVDENQRGNGLGQELLSGAEEQSRKLGCTHIYLDTFSFQAHQFYERKGYSEFGILKDYPIGHARHFLVKAL